MATTAHHYAAGILPITFYNGKLLFLVGKDVRDGTWSDFGGKVDPPDRRCPIATACREYYEETYGAGLGIKHVRARISPSTSVLLKSFTQNQFRYYMFVVQVPYNPYLRSAFHKALAFLKTRNMHRVYVEKTDLQWVTFNTLKAMPKRTVFANTLNRHMDFFERLATIPSRDWRALCASLAPTFELP